ncbi:MAG: hypothetical protein GKR89_26235 [Candidatus Latescibacteria bacterium]|nr:hypothetical protein [Candidatus Latescibacterota bacterium]
MSSPIKEGQPFSPEETQRIVEQFNRDGYCHLGPILDPDEIEALRDAMDRKVNDPLILSDEAGDHIRGTSLMRMFEYSNAFRDLVVREPLASLAEAILGDDCQLMSQNALYTEPNPDSQPDGPDGWHLDDLVHFPLPDDMDQHDPRITMPCFVLQIFTPVTDVDSVEYGPTQVVPGSHRAGRRPSEQDQPTFAGSGPVSMLAKAGDGYMFNNQIWHRGAPNASDRTRFMAGVTYSKRFVAQRFYPFVDYRMPPHVYEGASPRLQRFLGRHEKGSYG